MRIQNEHWIRERSVAREPLQPELSVMQLTNYASWYEVTNAKGEKEPFFGSDRYEYKPSEPHEMLAYLVQVPLYVAVS